MTTLRRLAVLGLLVVLVVSACGTSEATGTVVKVRADRAVEMLEAGGHTVVDLRGSAAYAVGHVEGALSLPADTPDLEARVAELEPDEDYLVYAGTLADSARLADRLAALGLQRVVDAGAFGLLTFAGAPIVEGDSPAQ